MDTWEVVLILILLTIAVSVIAKHEVPLALVTLLDNIYFQLAILGLTLGVAVVSPPVALVAVATIVIIYYIRNIVKIQIVQMNKRIEEEARRNFDREQAAKAEAAKAPAEGSKDDGPRIEITEQRRVLNISSSSSPSSGNATIDAALKEHETRPTSYSKDVGSRSTIGGMLNAEKEFEAPKIEMPNPRGEVKTVESFDMQATFNSPAPQVKEARTVVNEVDSVVFAKAGNVVPHNEDNAKPVVRQYTDATGQYPIFESRVQSKPEKYEQLDFMPMSDMGSNKFESVGLSIDDKMTILKKGLLPSSNPPPDYNMTVPPKASPQ